MSILKKYAVGSRLLGIKNPRDFDFIIVVNANINENDHVIYIPEDVLFKRMNLEYPMTLRYLRMYLQNYQLDKDIIGQDFPYTFHILDNRQKYIEVLKHAVDTELWAFNDMEIINKPYYMDKVMYHVAYTLFIMQNRSTTLTEEQKGIIQQIHDLEMPRSYAKELRLMIENLK